MFRNILIIAYRNIWKNKVFSFINIIGLSIGLSISFVIGILLYYDMTFDTYHHDRERIYRIVTDSTTPDGDFYNRGVAIPLGRYAKEQMTGLERVSTFFTEYLQQVENQEKNISFKNIEDAILTDAAYFELFEYDWLAGTPGSLSEPGNVVLTESRAARYFPNASPKEIIGKALVYNDAIPLTVSGVVADIEARSDLYFKEFLALSSVKGTPLELNYFNDQWNSTNSNTMLFIKTARNANPVDIQNQLDAIAREHADEETYALGQRRTFDLQPLSDLHFNGTYGIFNHSEYQASRTVLWSLAFVALFLLLLGCVNFINLNTAQATVRAKEIGIRKTLGSSRRQLIYQFMGETLLLTLAAALVSLFLSFWLLRIFSDFVPQGLGFELFNTPIFVTLVTVLLLFVALLSGFYPSLVLSDFKPVSVLKNQSVKGGDKAPLRKYLTVFQFVIAQVFIIATLVVGKQLNFLMSEDMGFKTDANVYIRAWHNDDLGKRLAFADALEKIPEVLTLSLANEPPASNNSNSATITFLKKGSEIHTEVQQLFGDLKYLDLYNIELLAGRDRLNDTIQEYVINETYSKILGFQHPQDAIGKMLKIGDEQFPIVGVMEDFYQRSLRSTIQPMALIGDSNREFYAQFNTIHLGIAPGAAQSYADAIDKIEDAWQTVYPEDEIELNFMDDTIKQFYEQERKTSVLLTWATGLAILISCLGLLGLVIHTTERRTKEIGIRKILGASLAQLNLLLCKEFLILVGIAFAIATPIAWWGMHSWLQDFAHKTDLSWWVFVVSGIAMLLIALAVASIRTIAAANRDPVKNLRTE